MLAMPRYPVAVLLCAALLALSLAACSAPKRPVVVGSKDETEQMLLGEIVAQHLEHRLGHPVERRTGLGGTAVLYQSILSSEVGIYPEYTGLIAAEILKEPADPKPQIVLARVRGEMERIAQIEVLDPLGFDNRSVMVVKAAGAEKLSTLTEAARLDKRWKLGITYDFQSRSDGLQELALYHLSLAPRIVDRKQLFSELEKGGVDMIATRATDGHLMSPDWKVLADDRDPNVFSSYEACLLVRKDLLAAEPGLRPALAELSGKFTSEIMRKLNAEVDVEHRPVAAVATDFLTQAGLR
jgi:glycine betaine/choline ABC-type transport system substrate-binding protein